jgi:hypothetical protein
MKPAQAIGTGELTKRSPGLTIFRLPMVCPLCSTRAAKRRCPALNQNICPVCCGTKRLVEIRCTDDCVYLASSRRHPAASVQRQHELDVALLLPAMADFTDRQSRFFFLFQSIALRHPADALRPLIDADVAEGAAATATTLEAASRGVIYEQAPATLNAQALSGAFRRAFEEIVQQVPGPRTPLERDAARALRGIEEAARRVGPIAGDTRTGFLGLMRRVLGSQTSPAGEHRQEPGPSIILP